VTKNEFYAFITYVDYSVFSYKQFTIDLVEYIIESLSDEDVNIDEVFVGALSYKLNTVLEIMDESLIDFELLNEILDNVNKIEL